MKEKNSKSMEGIRGEDQRSITALRDPLSMGLFVISAEPPASFLPADLVGKGPAGRARVAPT